MKKIKIIALFIILALIFMTITSYGATLNRDEVNQNEIKISIDTELGNVRAFDATLKITGDVTLDKFVWSANIKDEYLKKYVYDEQNNVITIYVATGNTNNLVDDKGVLEVGNIYVKSNSDQNQQYNITFQDINIMDGNYTKNVPDNKVENSQDTFTYVVNKQDNPGGNENPDNPGNNTGNDTNTNTNTNTNNNTSENSTDNTNTNNNDNNSDNNSNSNNTSNKNDNSNENKNISDMIANGILPFTGGNAFGYISIAIIIVIVVILIIYWYWRYKKINKIK